MDIRNRSGYRRLTKKNQYYYDLDPSKGIGIGGDNKHDQQNVVRWVVATKGGAVSI